MRTEHVVFLVRLSRVDRSEVQTAGSSSKRVRGGSQKASHTGNLCKATRQISLWLSSWVSAPDAPSSLWPIDRNFRNLVAVDGIIKSY